MSLLPQTRELLRFLNCNPAVRRRISAPRDATVLYAGDLLQPAYLEIAAMRRRLPQLASKMLLPDVLVSIRLDDQPFENLLLWADSIDRPNPKSKDRFTAWRALSGIYASNAVGAVSFVVGSGVTRAEKVFAATEVHVLARNPNIDELTRDVLAYYRRCIESGDAKLNFSLITG